MKRHGTGSTGQGRRRGTSFVELLISLAVLSVMMIGVLQLFALSLAVNKGAAARTHMTFRCQQVVENLRYYWNLVVNGRSTPSGITTSIPFTFTPGTYNLPYDTGDTDYAYWGPNGANVIEGPKGPYKLSYTIAETSASTNGMWVITVTAVPTDDTTATVRYFGVGPKSGKRIDYVAQFWKTKPF
jgi:hypothetical protein